MYPKFQEITVADKEIVLPEREEMLKRLVAVDDSAHLQQKFYPILLKSAGQQRVAQGIVMTLMLAVHDYTEDLPPMMSRILHMRMPEFIDALVIDSEVAQEAKDFLKLASGA